MTTHHSSVESIEQQLISYLEATTIDLSHQGEILIERLSIPASIEPPRKARLTYHLCKSPQGVIDAYVQVTQNEVGLLLELELCLKKYLTPTLSLSSAHIASLLYHLKHSLRLVDLVDQQGEVLSWEFDRTQRRIRLIHAIELVEGTQTDAGIRLLSYIPQLLIENHELSLGIIQEEAEYCQAMEQWRHARRAYLTWHELSQLTVEQLQLALVVFYSLKDWISCVRLLDEVSLKNTDEGGARLAYAGAILCRDILLDLKRALELSERSFKFHPSPMYQQTIEALQISLQEENLLNLKQTSTQVQDDVSRDTELFDNLSFDDIDELDFESKSEFEFDSEPEPEPEVDSEPEPEPEVDSEPEPEPEVDSEPEPESKLEFDTDLPRGKPPNPSKKSKRGRKQTVKRKRKKGKK